MKQGPLRRTDHLFIVGICTAFGKQDGIIAKGIGAADDRAQIAGILDAVQQDPAGSVLIASIGKAADGGDVAAGDAAGDLVEDRSGHMGAGDVRTGRDRLLRAEDVGEQSGLSGLFDQMHAFDEKAALGLPVFLLFQPGPFFDLCVLQRSDFHTIAS